MEVEPGKTGKYKHFTAQADGQFGIDFLILFKKGMKSMKHSFKRTLSLVLALVMALSCMSLPAFATGEECSDDNCEHVAAIGDTHYATLADAIAAASAGDTVMLLANVTITANIEINKTLTLDLNGKTITNNVADNRLFRVAGVTFTINGHNGHINTPDDFIKSYGFVDLRSQSNDASPDAKLIINDTTFYGTTSGGSPFMYRANGQEIELNNVNVTVPIGSGVIYGGYEHGLTASIVNGYEKSVKLSVVGGTYNYKSRGTDYGVFQVGTFDTSKYLEADGSYSYVADGVTVVANYGPIMEAHGTANFRNCNFSFDGTAASTNYLESAMAAAVGGTANVESGTYTGTYGAYVWSSGGTINISGGSYTGTQAALFAQTDTKSYQNAVATINVTGGEIKGALKTEGNATINISGGTFTNVSFSKGEGTSIIITGGTFDADPSNYVPAGYTVTENTGDKTTWTVSAMDEEYVAAIGHTPYESLAAAVAAAQDGDIITVLADCSGNGIQVPQGKFMTGLTVDFGGHTYKMDGTLVGSTGTETQAFQLLKNNTITFKNGTITSAKAKILIQNYSDLTLDGMTLTLDNLDYAYAYTLSNNNGNIVIDDTTINANPAGRFAFDVCRYSSYPSVSVTVQGGSVINGDVELSASLDDLKDGLSLTVADGAVIKGNVKVGDTLKAKIDNTEETKATVTLPSGYSLVPVANQTYVIGKVDHTVAQGQATQVNTTAEATTIVNGSGSNAEVVAYNVQVTQGNENETIVVAAPATVSAASINQASGTGTDDVTETDFAKLIASVAAKAAAESTETTLEAKAAAAQTAVNSITTYGYGAVADAPTGEQTTKSYNVHPTITAKDEDGNELGTTKITSAQLPANTKVEVKLNNAGAGNTMTKVTHYVGSADNQDVSNWNGATEVFTVKTDPSGDAKVTATGCSVFTAEQLGEYTAAAYIEATGNYYTIDEVNNAFDAAVANNDYVVTLFAEPDESYTLAVDKTLKIKLSDKDADGMDLARDLEIAAVNIVGASTDVAVNYTYDETSKVYTFTAVNAVPDGEYAITAGTVVNNKVDEHVTDRNVVLNDYSEAQTISIPVSVAGGPFYGGHFAVTFDPAVAAFKSFTLDERFAGANSNYYNFGGTAAVDITTTNTEPFTAGVLGVITFEVDAEKELNVEKLAVTITGDLTLGVGSSYTKQVSKTVDIPAAYKVFVSGASSNNADILFNANANAKTVNDWVVAIGTAGTMYAKVGADVDLSVTAKANATGAYDYASWTGVTGTGTGSTATASFTMGQADVTAKATFDPKTYTISYDLNTDTGSTNSDPATIANQTGVKYDETATLAVAPTRPGYTFAGWKIGSVYYDGSAAYKMYGDTTDETYNAYQAAVTAVAQWTPLTLGVATHNYNPDDPSDAVKNNVLNHYSNIGYFDGAAISLSGAYTQPSARSGYAFDGWSLTPGGSKVESFTWNSDTLSHEAISTWTGGSGITPSDRQLNVYAVWKPVKYAVSIVFADTALSGNGVSYTGDNARAYKSAIVAADIPAVPTNYEFVSYTWNGNTYYNQTDLITAFTVRVGDSTNPTTTITTQNTITINTKRLYTITDDGNDNVTLEGAGGTAFVTSADSLTDYVTYIKDHNTYKYTYTATASYGENSPVTVVYNAENGTVTIAKDALAALPAGTQITITVVRKADIKVNVYPLSNRLLLVTAYSAASDEDSITLTYSGEKMHLDSRFTDTNDAIYKNHRVFVTVIDYNKADLGTASTTNAIKKILDGTADGYTTRFDIVDEAPAPNTLSVGNYNVNGVTGQENQVAVDISDVTLVYNAYKGTYNFSSNSKKGGVLTSSDIQYLLSDVTLTQNGKLDTVGTGAPVANPAVENSQLVSMSDVQTLYQQAYGTSTTSGN